MKKEQEKTAWEKSVFGRFTAVNMLNALGHGLGSAIPVFVGMLNVDKVVSGLKETLTIALIASAIAFVSAFSFDVAKRLKN